MEVATVSAGCMPEAEVLRAAAAAAQIDMCSWLLHKGYEPYTALSSAAAAGHKHVCEWLLAKVPECRRSLGAAAVGAAGSGHIALLEWLLLQHQPPLRGGRLNGDVRATLLAHAARSCDLATLQRLHLDAEDDVAEQAAPAAQGHQQAPQPSGLLPSDLRAADILESAAASPTPDWRAKVEWLESRGHAPNCRAVAWAAAKPDAAQRLAWLRQRGYPLVAAAGGVNGAAAAAARFGNLDALRLLHAEVRRGGDGGAAAIVDLRAAAFAAAKAGHLDVLVYLSAEAGVSMDGLAIVAAEGGHLGVLAWLLQAPGDGGGAAAAAIPNATRDADAADGELDARLMAYAARSGSVELLAWLRQRGCPWDEEAVCNAAWAGCAAALEWLVEGGCPVPVDGRAYLAACANGDIVTQRCLAQLGCPRGSREGLFGGALDAFTDEELMHCLRQAGCPAPEQAVL